MIDTYLKFINESSLDEGWSDWKSKTKIKSAKFNSDAKEYLKTHPKKKKVKSDTKSKTAISTFFKKMKKSGMNT
jgi:hypothetical protein